MTTTETSSLDAVVEASSAALAARHDSARNAAAAHKRELRRLQAEGWQLDARDLAILESRP